MAETRRAYIYGAFCSSILCVILIILSIATDYWIVSTATSTSGLQSADSQINYGLFRGELQLNNLATPTFSTIYMTCIFDVGACAASCKTTPEAREEEVRALANRYRPVPTCVSITTVDMSNQLPEPAIISATLYICLLIVIFLQLLFAVAAAFLALLNAVRNPTEPMFGLPGVIWTNAASALLGSIVLLVFGIYWASSSLQRHLAFAYIATDLYDAAPSLGYSYWIMILAVVCSLANVGLINLRKYLLERDPPPPTLKVENHSDGTIFLY